MAMALQNRGDETAAYHHGGRYYEIPPGSVRIFDDDVARHLLGHLTNRGVVLAPTSAEAAIEPESDEEDEQQPDAAAEPKAPKPAPPRRKPPRRKSGKRTAAKAATPARTGADDGAAVVESDPAEGE